MEKKKVTMERMMETNEAAAYLEDLAKSIRAGKIVVEHGPNHVILIPPKIVEVEVEARTKKDKQKFELELSWTTAVPETEDEEPLKISSEESAQNPKPEEQEPV